MNLTQKEMNILIKKYVDNNKAITTRELKEILITKENLTIDLNTLENKRLEYANR